MAIATGGTTNYTTTRDLIIGRAFRILGAYGQGETGSTASFTEAAQALNDMAKEFQTDGMDLWKIHAISFALVAGTATYTIGTTGTVTKPAPLRVLQAWVTASGTSLDHPIIVITQSQYQNYGDKTTSGPVSQVWYQPPGAIITAATDAVGTLTCYQTPNATDTMNLLVHSPFEDFNLTGDEPDFPSYWNNALVWGLAADLSFEYGLGLSERGMIQKRASQARMMALSFGTEEGSLFVQPMRDWGMGK